MRAEGYAVESILRVLRQQGLAIAARTYRSWKRPARIVARTVTDALVEDKIRDVAWKFNPVTGRREMTPEGLYGRRKRVTLLRRQEGLAGTSRGAVDRAMRALGLEGIRRVKKLRTTIPGPDGKRAGDLLNRDFSAPAPNRVWVTDFTYVRTWAGFVYVAFVVDVFAQRIVGWHAASSMRTDLVMTPLRIALWQRDREGNQVSPGALVAHSDAGAQYTSVRYTEHLDLEGIAPSIRTVGDAFDNALMGERPVQDRVHPHHGLPRRAVPDARGRRVRGCRLGRLVQQPAPPRLPGDAHPGRVRDAPLRGPHPRARTHKVAAENLGRFSDRRGRARAAPYPQR